MSKLVVFNIKIHARETYKHSKQNQGLKRAINSNSVVKIYINKVKRVSAYKAFLSNHKNTINNKNLINSNSWIHDTLRIKLKILCGNKLFTSLVVEKIAVETHSQNL